MDILLENQFEKLAKKIERQIVVESLNELTETFLLKTSEAILEEEKADNAIFNKLASKYNIDRKIFGKVENCASALLYATMSGKRT